MKKAFKISTYLVFFLVVLFSFGTDVDAAILKECMYQYGFVGEDHVSNTKFTIYDGGYTEAYIIHYDGKGRNNLEMSTNWKDDKLDVKFAETNRCPSYLMVAKNISGYHVYLAYDEGFLQSVVNNKGYTNYFIEPLVNSVDKPNKPSGNQAYTSEEIEDANQNITTDKDEDEGKDITTDSSEGCEALGPLLEDIQFVWDIIKIAAPILVIVFGSADFAQAIISNDNDNLKKATSKFSKRLMFAAALFFLPYLIDLLFTISGLDQTITSAVCGIR